MHQGSDTISFGFYRLNIMTYDYSGPDNSVVTNNNAPMVDADPTSGYTVEANIKEWIADGASPSKMTLGMH